MLLERNFPLQNVTFKNMNLNLAIDSEYSEQK